LAIGSIMTAVAVLEIHMLSAADASMKANRTLGPSVPATLTVASANRL
jgi:hypothetical protein